MTFARDLAELWEFGIWKQPGLVASVSLTRVPGDFLQLSHPRQLPTTLL